MVSSRCLRMRFVLRLHVPDLRDHSRFMGLQLLSIGDREPHIERMFIQHEAEEAGTPAATPKSHAY